MSGFPDFPLARSQKAARRGAALADALVAQLATGQIDAELFIRRIAGQIYGVSSETAGLVATLARHLAAAMRPGHLTIPTDLVRAGCTCGSRGRCPVCHWWAGIAVEVEARRALRRGAEPS
jgi:hypothetical protein